MEKVRIGIVEDELIVAYDISDLLSEMGYECLEACASYEQAMVLLSGNPRPDIVLLDINLGGGNDGVDVARFIRRHLDIPLIFCNCQQRYRYRNPCQGSAAGCLPHQTLS